MTYYTKGIIVSSGAEKVNAFIFSSFNSFFEQGIELRGPLDIINLYPKIRISSLKQVLLTLLDLYDQGVIYLE